MMSQAQRQQMRVHASQGSRLQAEVGTQGKTVGAPTQKHMPPGSHFFCHKGRSTTEPQPLTSCVD